MSAEDPGGKRMETSNNDDASAHAILEKLFSEMADLTEEESADVLAKVLCVKSQRLQATVSA